MTRHPLHPALVHFPIACWSLAAAADFASLRWGEAAWQWSAGLLLAGCLTALPAVAAGLMEVRRVPEGAALRTLFIHMGLMLTALTLFATRLLLRQAQLEPLAPDAAALLLDAAALVVLVVGGHFGARLVYGHGIGQCAVARPEASDASR